MKFALTYDDVLLQPKYSDIPSRRDIDLTTDFTRNFKLKLPFVASPMDTICGFEMAEKLMKLGGVGIVHRFMSVDDQKDVISRLVNSRDQLTNDVWADKTQIPIACAVGVGDGELSRTSHLVNCGANVILIDVAHGHHQNVKDMIGKLIRFREHSKLSFDIIAGNVATKDGARFLVDCGVDGIRSLVGTGSLCTTRIETGHGVPSITSLMDVISGVGDIPVIADGGIRYTGDIAKALSVGADTVMLGSLLAGTQETPGSFIEKGNMLYKRYRGSASLETKINNNQPERNVEGESTIVPYKGGVKYILKRLEDGLRSAFSYSGSRNIQEFWNNSELIQITPAGHTESKPHLLK